MKGVCKFCGGEKDLTEHEIMARSYGGTKEVENVIPNICRECHTQLETNIDKNRASAGAGNPVNQIQSFNIGSTEAQLITGSALLNGDGQAQIDAGSPIYGMRCHHQTTGQNYIEVSMSGGSVVLITGSPSNYWVIYSLAKG